MHPVRMNGQGGGPPRLLEPPMRFLKWAARHYTWYAATDGKLPVSLRSAFARAGQAKAYEALRRVIDSLLACAPRDCLLHAPGCPASSEIEQAFILGLRCLQRGDAAGYGITMSAVAPLAVVRRVQSDMETLAGLLRDAREPASEGRGQWLSDEQGASSTVTRLRH